MPVCAVHTTRTSGLLHSISPAVQALLSRDDHQLQHMLAKRVAMKILLLFRMATLPVPEQRMERAPVPKSMFSQENREGKLVGTVEVSLVPSTRTRYLTLNAPEVTQSAEWQAHVHCHPDAFRLLQALLEGGVVWSVESLLISLVISSRKMYSAKQTAWETHPQTCWFPSVCLHQIAGQSA